MPNELAVIQAQKALGTMNGLRSLVRQWALHARALNAMSPSIDSLVLLQESDTLLQKLDAAKSDFQRAQSNIDSLSRSLSSRIPEKGGMASAAQWVPQLRAGAKQFSEAVKEAERELQKLYQAAAIGMNSPTRTPTMPDNIFELLLNFCDALSRWIEHRKRVQHR